MDRNPLSLSETAVKLVRGAAWFNSKKLKKKIIQVAHTLVI